MPKLTKEVVDKGFEDRREGSAIVIQSKQISSLEGLSNLISNPKQLVHLDLSFNMIRTIPPHLELFPSLLYLDLSTNLLTTIEGLDNLSALQVLRLSRNRITKIENLEGNRNLNALDLSMNQISRIERISHLRSMKLLYLYGNQISAIEGLEGMLYLKELRIEQNQIPDINHLALIDTQIGELQAHTNSIGNLDDVIVAVSHLPKLKNLSLYNNPVSYDPTYRFRILKFKNIVNLDGLLVKDYIRDVLEDMEENYDLDQIVVKSQHSISELIEHEREVKDTAIKLMKIQIDQLEDDFFAFKRAMEIELEKLNEYAAIIRTKKNLGEDVALDVIRVNEWKQRVQEMEKERLESIRQRKLKLEEEKKKYLRDKRANIDFTGKLYEIAQANPKLWREVKEEVWKKQVEFEDQNYTVKQTTVRKMSDHNFKQSYGQGVSPEMQINIAEEAMKKIENELGGQLARNAESRLAATENQAAEKIQQKAKDAKKSKACLIF
ncbi:unnamed protein product [Blepharisma stoltei]|uniref:Uncharacterized protein n=1 Tax=Blepharisma stoltei TaxID=1481888 RepID=A0AAU9K0B8_9CILI|nr:unnamed protein product [Blepharisma stoltei]